MRPTKSTTSSSAKAWRGRGADAQAQAVAGGELRKTRLDRRVAAAQFVIFGVGDGGRVFLIIAAIMAGDFVGQPRMLGLGLLFGEFVDGD
jgi:hypothetical protein